MKTHTIVLAALLLIGITCAGLTPRSAAQTNQQCGCNGLLCTSNAVYTIKPLLADAGFTSTNVAQFTGNFYATRADNSISVDETTANMQGGSGQSAIVMDYHAQPGVTALGSIFENGNNTFLMVDDVQRLVIISNVPTSDPHVQGAIYSVAGVLRISAG